MSHRLSSVRDRWRRRLRGAAVLAAAAGTALPLLVASGGAATEVDDVLALARAQVGDAYQWGGNGPDAWDCSGFTSYVWREAAGVTMPRVSRDQQRWAVAIPREQLLPGDLVFYGEPVHHVALYAGDGRVVDASSAKKGVLERAMWSAPDVRYGRVPRPGMPAVQPWTPPAPSPTAAPTTSPAGDPGTRPESTTATPAPAPTRTTAATASPTSTPRTAAPKPAATRTAAPAPRPAAVPVRALGGLPAKQSRPSSAVALKAVAALQKQRGARQGSDVSVLRDAWRRSGGVVLPTDRSALVARALQVPRPHLRVGDLVAYGTPATQVYLYAGKGYMVGRSADHGSVIARRVHTGDVRFLRLPG